MAGLLFDLIEIVDDLLLVSLGAILGSLLRNYLIKFLGSFFINKYCSTFIINMIAAFSLGLLLPFDPDAGKDILESSGKLIICVGFLGSFSTFSSFIKEVYDELVAFRYRNAFILTLTSTFVGIAALALGQKISYG